MQKPVPTGMNQVASLVTELNSDLSIQWGITLLHFLWQGAVIGLLALVAARLLRSQSASVRYWLNATALLACPICVAWTFAVVDVPESWRVSSNQQSHGSLDSGGIPIETSSTYNLVDVPYPKLDPPEVVSNADAASIPLDATAETPATTPVATDTVTSTMTEWMPIVARWIAILYAVGVVCFLVRLAIALWGGHRLRAISTPVSDSALLELIRTQAHRIGLKLVPVVAYCERVAVPTVIGVLRPMILLPATLTTGLTIDELSGILSHELAHIRRYDLWMNLLQRIIESLLFFHPVVWFLSHRLSAEREICCDDLVIRSGHQPMNYAGALLRMAELCAGISPQNSVSLAATSGGTNLLEHRVLRLIHKSPSRRLNLNPKGIVFLFCSLILLLAFTWSASWRPSVSASDEASSSTAAAVPYEQTDVTISGRVQLEDGTPVKISGEIRVNSQSGNSRYGGYLQLTDGRFSVKCPPGTIALTVFAKGYAPSWTDKFEVTAGEKNDAVIILKSGVSKTIRVVDEGDNPVANAALEMYPEIHGETGGPTQELKTDESGRLKLEHVATTRYDFRIKAPKFQILRTAAQDISDKEEIVHRLKRCQTSTGRIFNSDGTSAAGAKLFRFLEVVPDKRGPGRSFSTSSSGEGRWYGEYIATTNHDGVYELDQLNDESVYSLIVEGADGSRLMVTGITAGESDREIKLPKRRDLMVSVIGDTHTLPQRNGKPFLFVRHRVETEAGDSSYSTSLGEDIPLEFNAEGGVATYRGLIVDPQADPLSAEVEVSPGYNHSLKKTVRIEPEGETKVTFYLSPAKQEAVGSKPFDEKTIDPGLRVPIRYPFCVVETDNIQPRSLNDAISSFNLTSQKSPTGVLQPPITEEETREAIAKFAAESHVPEEVRTQLEQILKSGELPANAYFRRFTRFDDGKQMQDVWWVRLVVETKDGPVYSVPVQTTSLSARPYTQMERQQNAADGMTLIGRVASYYQLPVVPVEAATRTIEGTEDTFVLRTNSNTVMTHAYRISRIAEFDREVIEVTPVGGNPKQVNLLASKPGQTRIKVVDEFSNEYQIGVTVVAVPSTEQSDALTARLTSAIKAKDAEAIIALFKTTDVSDDLKQFIVAELLALSETQIHSTKLTPVSLSGNLRTWASWQRYKPNLPVVAFLEVEYTDAAKKRKTLALELGVEEGELRLVNYIKDGEANPPQELNPGPSITGHLEPLADGTHLVTDIITNPGLLLSAHLANEEVRLRDFRPE